MIAMFLGKNFGNIKFAVMFVSLVACGESPVKPVSYPVQGAYQLTYARESTTTPPCPDYGTSGELTFDIQFENENRDNNLMQFSAEPRMFDITRLRGYGREVTQITGEEWVMFSCPDIVAGPRFRTQEHCGSEKSNIRLTRSGERSNRWQGTYTTFTADPYYRQPFGRYCESSYTVEMLRIGDPAPRAE